MAHLDILLPVGISFYTFIQIGFLVEVYNRQVGEVRFRHYLLFASFFPCVTAGPIVLQRDMLPQLASARPAGLDSTRIAVALTVFGIGLFKKLILADSIAPFADGVFDGAAAGAAGRRLARLDRRACLHPAALLRLLRLLATWRSASPTCSGSGCR